MSVGAGSVSRKPSCHGNRRWRRKELKKKEEKKEGRKENRPLIVKGEGCMNADNFEQNSKPGDDTCECYDHQRSGSLLFCWVGEGKLLATIKIQSGQEHWYGSSYFVVWHVVSSQGSSRRRSSIPVGGSDVRDVDSIPLTAAPKADFGSNSWAIIL